MSKYPNLFELEVSKIRDEYLKKKHTNLKDQFKINTLFETILNDEDNTNKISGMKRLNLILQELNFFDKIVGIDNNPLYNRSKQQKIFHKHFIEACLHKIFKNDYLQNVSRLLEEFKFDNIKQTVGITTPRQFGKTTAVALFSAAMLLCMDSFNIAIVSTGIRAARKLCALVFKMLNQAYPGQNNPVKNFNAETLEVYNKFGGVCVLKCYPCNVNIST